MKKFEDRIKYLRGSMTQEEFANLIGATKQKISNYEAGIVKPSFDVLHNIANKLDINLNWLLTGEGEICKARAPDTDYNDRIRELEEENRLLRDRLSQISNLTQAIEELKKQKRKR